MFVEVRRYDGFWRCAHIFHFIFAQNNHTHTHIVCARMLHNSFEHNTTHTLYYIYWKSTKLLFKLSTTHQAHNHFPLSLPIVLFDSVCVFFLSYFFSPFCFSFVFEFGALVYIYNIRVYAHVYACSRSRSLCFVFLCLSWDFSIHTHIIAIKQQTNNRFYLDVERFQP